MKKFDMSDEDMQLLKTSLLAFVRRVAAGVGSSPEEVQILPEVTKLLVGSLPMLNNCDSRFE